MRKLYAIPFLLLALCPVTWADDEVKPGTNLRFVVIETFVEKVGVPVSSENRQEHRWYISELVGIPDLTQSRQLAKQADDYFTSQVVKSLKDKGLKLKYYDSDVKINGGAVYALETETDAKDCYNNALESCKTKGGNVYSFVWSLQGGAANPKLIHRDKEQPLYEGSTKKKP